MKNKVRRQYPTNLQDDQIYPEQPKQETWIATLLVFYPTHKQLVHGDYYLLKCPSWNESGWEIAKWDSNQNQFRTEVNVLLPNNYITHFSLLKINQHERRTKKDIES